MQTVFEEQFNVTCKYTQYETHARTQLNTRTHILSHTHVSMTTFVSKIHYSFIIVVTNSSILKQVNTFKISQRV